MSCNGCRILRKGCNEKCILRESLQGIQSPQAQANAAVFVAKFFGRAGLMSFLSSVPPSQRPAMLQSLLYEACGRTVNPVNGAVGLLSTGNWHLCEAAVDTVFRGGVISPMQQTESIRVPLPPMEEELLHDHDHSFEEASDHQHVLQGINVDMSRFPKRKPKRSRRVESPEEEQESGTTTSESCLEYNFQKTLTETETGSGHDTPVLRFFL